MVATAKSEPEMTSPVQLLPVADVLETLSTVTAKVAAVILDPWYNRGVGGQREDYDEWLGAVIRAATEKATHVFVWGFPEILANQIRTIPDGCRLVAWLTWYYKNCPSVIRGWRSAQNACLHIARSPVRCLIATQGTGVVWEVRTDCSSCRVTCSG